MIKKINLDSITDQVRHLLQREIEQGNLTPGTRIREDEFAKELGISKSPIRVALHQLKQDGIVRIEARRGFYVALPTNEQVIQLTEMREVLEGLAARRAAARKDKAFIRELAGCFAGFREKDLDKRRMEYSRADLRFQRLLAESSQSGELIRALEIVNLRLHMSRLYAGLMASHDLIPVHQQHLEIIAAIKAGDPDRAEAATCAHVAIIRRLIDLRARQGLADATAGEFSSKNGELNVEA